MMKKKNPLSGKNIKNLKRKNKR